MHVCIYSLTSSNIKAPHKWHPLYRFEWLGDIHIFKEVKLVNTQINEEVNMVSYYSVQKLNQLAWLSKDLAHDQHISSLTATHKLEGQDKEQLL